VWMHDALDDFDVTFKILLACIPQDPCCRLRWPTAVDLTDSCGNVRDVV